jgi:hypothetical protein
MRDLGRDYLRGFLGLAICVVPFFWVTPMVFITIILAAMAAVFILLLWQTAMRQITRVIIDDEAITLVTIRRRRIPWDRLQRFELSYFTTSKDLTGFMEAKLKGDGTTIRIGSGIDDFRTIVVATIGAAMRNRIDFKASTIANLRSLEIGDPRIDAEDDA